MVGSISTIVSNAVSLPQTMQREYPNVTNATTSFFNGLFHAGQGTLCAAASFFTLGKYSKITDKAKSSLENSSNILAKPYAHLLRAVNQNSFYLLKQSKDSKGFLASYIPDFSQDIRKLETSENRFTRKVTSRLANVLYALAVMITRAVDGVIGTGAAILSLATKGKFLLLNQIAYDALTAPKGFSQLFEIGRHIIAPGLKNTII